MAARVAMPAREGGDGGLAMHPLRRPALRERGLALHAPHEAVGVPRQHRPGERGQSARGKPAGGKIRRQLVGVPDPHVPAIGQRDEIGPDQGRVRFPVGLCDRIFGFPDRGGIKRLGGEYPRRRYA